MPKFHKYFVVFLYVGLISGILSSLFLYSLQTVTKIRVAHPNLIFGLPIFGLLFGLILKYIPNYFDILPKLAEMQKKKSRKPQRQSLSLFIIWNQKWLISQPFSIKKNQNSHQTNLKLNTMKSKFWNLKQTCSAIFWFWKKTRRKTWS